MTLFLISAARAVVEMLGLCLLGQGLLYLLAGRKRSENRIYQAFALVTKGPRRIVATLLPGSTNPATISMVSFAILLLLWIGFAFIRKFV